MVASPADAVRPRLWLGLEFAALYLGAPLAIALFMPGDLLFPALVVFSVIGMLLLWRTGGFGFRSLVRGWSRMPWLEVLALSAATLLAGVVILYFTHPERLFAMLGSRMLPLIWIFYPILSALPQELIFRPLFFHRYASLLPSGQGAIAINAAIFSFAHLLYWSSIVAVMTFVGGWIFARAYLRHGFPAAWVLHAVAGNMLFTVGMGVYFWTGNVERPF